MSRIQTWLLGVAITVMMATPAVAQNLPFFSGPMSIGVGRDSGFISGNARLSDDVAIVQSPLMSLLRKSTERTTMTLKYRSEWELFSTYKDLNSWNHTASFSFFRTLSPLWSMDIADDAIVTRDPARHVSDRALFISRRRFVENVSAFTLTRTLRERTKATLRVGNTISRFPFVSNEIAQTVAVIPTIDESRQFIQMTTTALARLTHRLSPRNQVTGTYSAMRLKAITGGFNPALTIDPLPANTAHDLSAGYSYSLRPELQAVFSGGATLGVAKTYSLLAEIVGRLGPIGARASYNRSLSMFRIITPSDAPQIVGLLPQSLYRGITVRVDGTLLRRIGLSLDATKSDTSLELSTQRIGAVTGAARLTYRLTSRIRAFGEFQLHQQSASQIAGSSIDRKRYLTGLDIALNPFPRTSTR